MLAIFMSFYVSSSTNLAFMLSRSNPSSIDTPILCLVASDVEPVGLIYVIVLFTWKNLVSDNHAN